MCSTYLISHEPEPSSSMPQISFGDCLAPRRCPIDDARILVHREIYRNPCELLVCGCVESDEKKAEEALKAEKRKFQLKMK